MTTINSALTPLPHFGFSSAALAQLARIKQQYFDRSPNDPPVMLGIFWGWPVSAAGKQTGPGAPTLGYWRKSEFTEAARSEVRQADGMDFIFSVMPADRGRFEGKVIDYTPERAFFLRGRGEVSR
jgi:hypothetical protein